MATPEIKVTESTIEKVAVKEVFVDEIIEDTVVAEESIWPTPNVTDSITEKRPSNWHIAETDKEGQIIATSYTTLEVFIGTMKRFNELMRG